MEMALTAWCFFSLACLGAFHVAALSFRLLAYLALCLRPPKDLRRRYGAWAVVTGPTSGIGRSISLELARLGLNVVLVGRDAAKLRDMSETISRTHGVKTKTVLFDLSHASTAQGLMVLGSPSADDIKSQYYTKRYAEHLSKSPSPVNLSVPD
ncbi:hypothetical protein ACQ4PT_059891 [Festuca glaucescens]